MKLLLVLAAAAFAWGQSDVKRTIIPKQDDSETGILSFREKYVNGVNEVGLRAPASIASNFFWTLPSADGTAGYFLKTDGAGVLSWDAAVCATCFQQNGNSFGATAFLGTNDNQALAIETNGTQRWTFTAAGHLQAASNNTYDIGAGVSANSPRNIYAATTMVTPKIGRDTSASLTFFTDSADRWSINSAGMWAPAADITYDFGLTGTRVRGIYAQFGDFATAAGTSSSDYVSARKYNISNSAGGAGSWDIQAAGSFVSNSQFKLRDNAGGRLIEADRAVSGSRVNNFGLFANLIPRQRATGGGDDISDSVNPNLGAVGNEWAEAHVKSLTINTATTPVVGRVWTATSTGGAGAWADNLGGTQYDVRSYGAVCDGATDDTAAIQAAIDAAGAASGGMVVLPNGTCEVTTVTIATSFLGIRGQGRAASTLLGSANQAIIAVDTAAGDLYYTSIQDMTILGGGGASTAGIDVFGANGWERSTVERVYFQNLRRGLYLRNTGLVGWLAFRDNITDLAGVTSGTGIDHVAEGGTGNIYSNNQFIQGTGGYAIHMHGDGMGDIVINSNHSELGNFLNADCTSVACLLYGQRFVVNDNKIDNSTVPIRFNNISNSTALGNRITGSVTDPVTQAGTSTNNVVDAYEARGILMASANTGLGLNAFASGRVRIGTLDENVSGTVNGIDMKDTAQSIAIGLGQQLTRSVGLIWNYNGTAANASATLYTYGASNPLQYVASYHNFSTGSVGINGVPTYPLDVNGQTGRIGTTGTEHYLQFGRNATAANNFLIGAETGAFALYQGVLGGVATERMRITAAGSFTMSGDVLPNTNDTKILGSTSLRWASIAGVDVDFTGGQVLFKPGSSPVDGYVWTAQGTTGAGDWEAAPACSTCFLNGGNTTGAAMFLGTNDNQALAIETNGTQIWTFNTTGHFYAAVDNSYDIGSGGANRPRNLYIAGTGTFGGVVTIGGNLIPQASVAGDLIPSSNDVFVNGTTSFRWASVAVMDLNIGASGSITANSNAGLSVTKTVRASGGAADCTLVFTMGLLTGGTC